MKAKRSTGLLIIGILKLISAALLTALALGIFHMMGRDIGSLLEQYVHMLHLNVGSKFITNLLAKASHVTPQQLRKAGTVTLIYALLYVIEGVGLLLAKHWAEYLTIILTGAFIPLEVYEVIHKLNTSRVIILIVNSVIVVYLIYRLRLERQNRSGQDFKS